VAESIHNTSKYPVKAGVAANFGTLVSALAIVSVAAVPASGGVDALLQEAINNTPKIAKVNLLSR
jgi:hypothetical protein